MLDYHSLPRQYRTTSCRKIVVRTTNVTLFDVLMSSELSKTSLASKIDVSKSWEDIETLSDIRCPYDFWTNFSSVLSAFLPITFGSETVVRCLYSIQSYFALDDVGCSFFSHPRYAYWTQLCFFVFAGSVDNPAMSPLQLPLRSRKLFGSGSGWNEWKKGGNFSMFLYYK